MHAHLWRRLHLPSAWKILRKCSWSLTMLKSRVLYFRNMDRSEKVTFSSWCILHRAPNKQILIYRKKINKKNLKESECNSLYDLKHRLYFLQASDFPFLKKEMNTLISNKRLGNVYIDVTVLSALYWLFY